MNPAAVRAMVSATDAGTLTFRPPFRHYLEILNHHLEILSRPVFGPHHRLGEARKAPRSGAPSKG